MKLSNNQIEIIRAQIARSIQIQSLQDDVLDHVCCTLEDVEDLTCEFEEAILVAVKAVAPAGLRQLERETLLLLHAKYIFMKKFMYLLGLGSAIASSMGLSLKLLHMPGGDFLLTYGLLMFTLAFLPLLIFVRFRDNLVGLLSEKLKMFFALGAALLTGAAIVMRLFHINGSEVEMMFVGGAALFSFGFLPILFFNMYKKAIA